MKIWLKTYRYLKNVLSYLESIEECKNVDFLVPRLDQLLLDRDQNAPDELIDLNEEEIDKLNVKLSVAFNSILRPTIPIKFTNLIYGPLTQASGGFGLSTGALLLLKITLLPVIFSASILVGAGIAIYVADRTFSEEDKAKDTLQADLFDSQVKLCCSQVIYNLSKRNYENEERLSHHSDPLLNLTTGRSSGRSSSSTTNVEMQTMPNNRQPPKISAGSFTPPPLQPPPRLSRSAGRAAGYFGSLMALVYAGAAIKAGALIGAATLITVLGPVGFGIAVTSIVLFSIFMASKHHEELTYNNTMPNKVANQYRQAITCEQESDRLNKLTENLRQTRQTSHQKNEPDLPQVHPSPVPSPKQSRCDKISSFFRNLFLAKTNNNEFEQTARSNSLPTVQV